MPTQDTTTSPSGLEAIKLLAEVEVPFPPDQVQWRVTNTTNDKKRGQVVSYADPRAYTDRLNALFSPRGWTREYKIETMNNITRVKKGESLLSGKMLVICTVTVIGLWSHSGTGEEWADDDNGMTAADAQAFKRACSCFGLGRYFYDIPAIWIDLDQNRRPVKTPVLSAWDLPENWRKGMRPRARSGDGKCREEVQGKGPKEGHSGGNGSVFSQPTNGNSENGGKANGLRAADSGDELDHRILGMEKVVGAAFYRNILREYGRVNQPKLIRDVAIKQKVLEMLESVARGIDRLEAVLKRMDPNTVQDVLAKLQAPPLGRIADMKTLQHVVLGLEELAGPNEHHAA